MCQKQWHALKGKAGQVVAYIELIFLRQVEFNLTKFNKTCNINEV